MVANLDSLKDEQLAVKRVVMLADQLVYSLDRLLVEKLAASMGD